MGGGKGGVTLFLFTDDMTLYKGNSKEFTKKLLESIHGHSKVTWYKIDTQKSLIFLYIINKHSKNEIKETIQLVIV